jgi:hypothetical protein
VAVWLFCVVAGWLAVCPSQHSQPASNRSSTSRRSRTAVASAVGRTPIHPADRRAMTQQMQCCVVRLCTHWLPCRRHVSPSPRTSLSSHCNITCPSYRLILPSGPKVESRNTIKFPPRFPPRRGYSQKSKQGRKFNSSQRKPIQVFRVFQITQDRRDGRPPLKVNYSVYFASVHLFQKKKKRNQIEVGLHVVSSNTAEVSVSELSPRSQTQISQSVSDLGLSLVSRSRTRSRAWSLISES